MNGNAIIKSTMLGYEDHGILTLWLMLEQDGGCQGFGGYRIDSYNKDKKEICDSSHCGFWIRRVLETVGVGKYEDLPGKYVRVDGDFTSIKGIGNIIKDIWFYPKKEIEELEGK